MIHIVPKLLMADVQMPRIKRNSKCSFFFLVSMATEPSNSQIFYKNTASAKQISAKRNKNNICTFSNVHNC